MKSQRSALVLVSVVAAMTLAPIASRAATQVDCTDRHNTYAKFLQPANGSVAANTQAGGISIDLLPGSPIPSLTFSSTGTMDVKIEYACLKYLGLEVYKDGQTTPIHTNSWQKNCEQDVQTDTVSIGLNAGHYTFKLSGASCIGIGLKFDDHGGFVGDPPLPVK